MDTNGRQPFRCSDCETEQQAYDSALSFLDEAEQNLIEAEEAYIACTQDCDDEEAAYIAAADIRDAAANTVDYAESLLLDCLNGDPPPTPSFTDDGMHSVLVRR